MKGTSFTAALGAAGCRAQIKSSRWQRLGWFGALTRLCPARRACGRRGAHEARPRRVPIIIACQMVCGGERLGAFRGLPDPIEDRQQIDVGERELLADKIAGPGDRL